MKNLVRLRSSQWLESRDQCQWGVLVSNGGFLQWTPDVQHLGNLSTTLT